MALAVKESLASFQREDPDMATAMQISSDEFHAEYQHKHRENVNPQPVNATQMQNYRYAVELPDSWYCMLIVVVLLELVVRRCPAPLVAI